MSWVKINTFSIILHILNLLHQTSDFRGPDQQQYWKVWILNSLKKVMKVPKSRWNCKDTKVRHTMPQTINYILPQAHMYHNPGGGEIFHTCPDRPWGPPSLLYNGYQVFPGGKERPGRGMMLTPHPLLVPWSWKGRSIPLLPLWAIWPVQSLSACTRVHFTLHMYHNFTFSICTFACLPDKD